MYCMVNECFKCAVDVSAVSYNRLTINNPSNAQVADDYSKLMKHCRKYKLNYAVD